MSLDNPKVGMVVVRKASGSMYMIEAVQDDRVRLVPYWTGRNCRSTWKSITHLDNDYRQEQK
jgi:hypothetical protein